MKEDNNTWIKLYRKIWENPVICKDADHLALWVYLLAKSVWKDTPQVFNGKKVILKPGQYITGRKILAKELKINESKIRRILYDFESDNQIERKVTNKATLITIINWSKYQDNETKVTNKRPTNDQQVTTKEEYKNIRYNYYTNNYTNDLFNDFLEMRKKLKAVNNERSIKLLLNKLEPYNDNIKNKMLENAIANSWKSVYELKDYDKPKKEVPVPDWLNQTFEKEKITYTEEELRLRDEIIGNH